MSNKRVDGEKVVHEYSYLAGRKASLDSHFQDLTDYIVPTKTDITHVDQTPNTRTSRRRYDSTAVHSNILLSSSIHGNLTSDASQWFGLTLGEHELNENKEVKDWLQDCSRKLFHRLSASSFSSEYQEGYECLTGYGTTAIFQGSKTGNRGVVTHTFETIPLRQYVFRENEEGIAEAFYRKYSLTVGQILQRWGNHPFFRGLTEDMKKCMASDKASEREKKHELVVYIDKRDYYNQEQVKTALDYEYVHAVVDCKTKHVLIESGYEENPIIVPRWRKTADDDGWGTGIGAVALPDVMSLNEAKRMGFKAWAKDLDPPIVATHKGVIGSLRTSAGGVIYKRRGAEVDTLQSGARWDSTQFNYGELRDQIRAVFYTDKLQLHESPAMTAAEAQIRYEMIMKIMGPTYGRLKKEMHNPTIYRAFNISLRAGHFLPPPQALLQALNSSNPPKLDVEYYSPMARAQRSDEIAAIERTYMLASQIAETKQNAEVFDNLDDDEALRHGADITGMPSKIMVDPKKVKQMREGRAQANAQIADNAQAEEALGQAEKVVDIQSKARQ